jgi:alpha-methylacyl-CoA racemase
MVSTGTNMSRSGPLRDLKVLEVGGIGPVPFCSMLLSDLGAEVVRIDRKGEKESLLSLRGLKRGRRSIGLDLKKPAAIEAVLALVDSADVLIEGYRPGVMERLGLGPETCMARNSRIVYGRMTGWGQDGPLARSAGHDLSYIALTGALAAIGTTDGPVVPLNLIGDFGGGAVYLAYGIMCALFERQRSGVGQVVDAAITDGAAHLMTMFYNLHAVGNWSLERSANFVDGAAPFYRTYRCADGGWIAVAAIEPEFYRLFIAGLGLKDVDLSRQWQREDWPRMIDAIGCVVAEKTRAQWTALFEGSDACVVPVLDLSEAPSHPHNVARKTFVEVGGIVQPAPAPRFSRTPASTPTEPSAPGDDTIDVLHEWGIADSEIERLREAAAI